MSRASLPLMSRNSDSDSPDAVPKLSLWERFRYTVVKPDDDPKAKPEEPQQTVEELEAEIARASDKERNIGLVAAPVGAVVALLVSADLINHARSLGQSTAVYQNLTFVLLGMALLVLVSSLLRKRLFEGITMALFGLGIFNLHYWGFGVPFVLAGAWLLVRAYRLSQKLKLATVNKEKGYVPPPRGLPSAGGVLPRPNKRYTPSTARKRPSGSKP
jgi:hypothetical protein